MLGFNDKPLIVQSDKTILLEVTNPAFEQARDAIAPFCELVKSPDYVHTYRLTPLSLWNAAAAGMSGEAMIEALRQYAKFDIPPAVTSEIESAVSRYGLVRLERQLVGNRERLTLYCDDQDALALFHSFSSIAERLGEKVDSCRVIVNERDRGFLKQALMKLGYPVQDLAGYIEGERYPLKLKTALDNGTSFVLRDYQRQAVGAFYAGGSVYGGSGVLVLPCGAGKTVIGMAVMAEIQEATLILTSNYTSVKQWIRELADKTTIAEEDIGEYTGEKKEVKPVTVATYQILTHRPKGDDDLPHMALFNQRNWGLVIYDEVHLLPAPVFRMTADIQAKRRLGLTATLVREDGHEEDVFSLVGAKKYEAPWKVLEREGWIATAVCTEIRVFMDEETKRAYLASPQRQKFRIASENRRKAQVLKKILARHQGEPTLVIGQYIHQLEAMADQLGLPVISGRVRQKEREALYEAFKQGQVPVLLVSKVANFAVDLPQASVAVQLSGSFGSRQEEAQRLGRILRPKKGGNQAFFYTLVTHNSEEQTFAAKRQLFLVEQGYRYRIQDESEWLAGENHESA